MMLKLNNLKHALRDHFQLRPDHYGGQTGLSDTEITALLASGITFGKSATLLRASDGAMLKWNGTTFAVDGGGKVSAKPRTSIMSKCLCGDLGVPVAVVTDPYSQLLQTTAEGRANVVRFLPLNAAASQQTVRISVCGGSTLGPGGIQGPGVAGLAQNTLGLQSDGRPVGSVLTWQPYRDVVMSAAPRVATQGASGGAENNAGAACGIGDPGWFPIATADRADGGTLPIIYIGFEWQPGALRTFANLATSNSGAGASVAEGQTLDQESATYGRTWRVLTNPNKAAVTTQGWWTTGTLQFRETIQFPAGILQYGLQDSEGNVLVLYSDSIDDGFSASTARLGWARELQNLVSTPAAPMEVCNLAIGGAPMERWLERMNVTVPLLKNVVNFAKAASPNNTVAPLTASNVASWRTNFGQMKALCESYPGNLFITGTMGPTPLYVWGASDLTYRVPYNDQIRGTNVRYFDFDAFVRSDGLNANGQYGFQPGYSTDQIHWATTCHRAVAAGIKPTWNGF